MTTPILILITVIILLVVAALVYGVRRRDDGAAAPVEAAISQATADAQRYLVGVPLAQQLAPPGGFTLEQQVVLGKGV